MARRVKVGREFIRVCVVCHLGERMKMKNSGWFHFNMYIIRANLSAIGNRPQVYEVQITPIENQLDDRSVVNFPFRPES